MGKFDDNFFWGKANDGCKRSQGTIMATLADGDDEKQCGQCFTQVVWKDTKLVGYREEVPYKKFSITSSC